MQHALASLAAPLPSEPCDICGAPFEYTPKQNTDHLPAAIWFFHFDRLEHPACSIERERRAAIEQEEARKALQGEQLRGWAERSKLPRAWEMLTLERYRETPDNREALSLIRAWSPSDDFGLLLIGPSGVGKSHIGIGLIQREAKLRFASEPRASRNTLPAYFTAVELLAQTKANNFELPPLALQAPVLLIDDIGAENITEWSREIFFRVFDYRWSHRLPTLVTTNLVLDELKARLHERLVSRLVGLCLPISLRGRDVRAQQIAERLRVLKARAGGESNKGGE